MVPDIDAAAHEVWGPVALVDLGGSQIRVAVSDPEGNFANRTSRPTPGSEGGEAILEALIAAIRETMSASGLAASAISIAAPGPLDPRRGIVARAPNLPGWTDVPLVRIIRDEFGLPTLLGNDANLAALAEREFGAARGHQDVVYLTISTGIGGGVISDGILLVGSHGYAAELGHNSIMVDGPLCACGNRGCVESLAAGPAIARQARQAIEAGAQSDLIGMCGGDLSTITAKLVTEAAQQGDVLARQVFQQAGNYLGVAVTNFLYAFDPTVVVLGGGVSKAGPLLFEPVMATVEARIPRAYWEHVQIVPAALGDDVSLMGALALYLSEKRAKTI